MGEAARLVRQGMGLQWVRHMQLIIELAMQRVKKPHPFSAYEYSLDEIRSG